MLPITTELTVLDLVPFGQTGRDTRFFALRLSHPHWLEWHPGQFVMLRPHSFRLEQIWGRPFSICHMTDKHLICFFQICGEGSQKIASLKSGDKIICWGPLGNYFAMQKDTPTLLLAGGIGMAPFVGYVNKHPQPWNLHMLFGHREPIGCYPIDSINEHIPIDTLRENKPGDLDNLIFSIQERIKDCAEQKGLTLACGPEPFLATVQKFAAQYNCRTQLSLENRMACGVGACLGCAKKTTDIWPVKHQRGTFVPICSNGPVFWSNQIEL